MADGKNGVLALQAPMYSFPEYKKWFFWNHNWVCSYHPHRIPVHLADSTIIYSAGRGSVVFVPELEGKREWPIEFSNVLHVPDLHSNLLSVLYLTRNKLFSVVILETVMSFICSWAVLFTARVNSSNCVYLEGTTSSSASPIIDSVMQEAARVN